MLECNRSKQEGIYQSEVQAGYFRCHYEGRSVRDEENDRPAWGKRDPLEVEAKMDSFDSDRPILDGSIHAWDGEQYRVNIRPVGSILGWSDSVLVTVTLLHADGSDLDASSHLESRTDDRQSAIHDAVWNLICELGAIWRGHKEHEARREYMGGKCIDLETGHAFDWERFDAQR